MRWFSYLVIVGIMSCMLTGCSLNSLNGLVNGSKIDANSLIDQAIQWLEDSSAA
jgi:hypothetical protein